MGGASQSHNPNSLSAEDRGDGARPSTGTQGAGGQHVGTREPTGGLESH